MDKQNKRKTGMVYEKKAAACLETKGYRILERNYRCRTGEIDLIAKTGGTLVFVEVKYRATAAAGHPLEAVPPAKQKKIRDCARYYLMQTGQTECMCRFDVIGILGDTLFHVTDAFS